MREQLVTAADSFAGLIGDRENATLMATYVAHARSLIAWPPPPTDHEDPGPFIRRSRRSEALRAVEVPSPSCGYRLDVMLWCVMQTTVDREPAAPRRGRTRRWVPGLVVAIVVVGSAALMWAFLDVRTVAEYPGSFSYQRVLCSMAIPPSDGHDYLVLDLSDNYGESPRDGIRASESEPPELPQV